MNGRLTRDTQREQLLKDCLPLWKHSEWGGCVCALGENNFSKSEWDLGWNECYRWILFCLNHIIASHWHAWWNDIMIWWYNLSPKNLWKFTFLFDSETYSFAGLYITLGERGFWRSHESRDSNTCQPSKRKFPRKPWPQRQTWCFPYICKIFLWKSRYRTFVFHKITPHISTI